MRLIDSDAEVYGYVKTWICDCSEFGRQSVMAVEDISYLPEIDPETLPIVQELRAELEQVTAQRDELFKMLNDVCKDTREQHADESVCGLCEYDGAYIGQSGDWENECPGFNSDDCFCMKRSIREKFGQSENMSLDGPDGDNP